MRAALRSPTDIRRAERPRASGRRARARGTAARRRSTRWCRCAAPPPARARKRRAPRRARRTGGRPGSGSHAADAWSSAFARQEDVTAVADGLDELRMLGIRLDLLAHAHDAQIDAAVERVELA